MQTDQTASFITIGDLERAAGVTDRVEFWAPFASIRGTSKRGHKLVSNGLEAGMVNINHFGMALAASVLLALVTVAIMGVVERLRVGSLGSF